MPQPSPWPTTWPYPHWIAHRGAGGLAPENTLAALREGARHGHRMFECDARLSADGVVFLLHDHTLDRTTSGQGPAQTHDWASLSQLDAGAWHSPTFAGEPLATLSNVARFCLANGFALNIEIKPNPGQAFQTGWAVAHLAAQLWSAAPSVAPPLLTSFQPEALQAAREAAPSLPRGLLLDTLSGGWLPQAQSLACVAVISHHPVWTAQAVQATQAAGLRALAYTVNEQADAKRLQAWGVDGLITDAVDRFSPGR